MKSIWAWQLGIFPSHEKEAQGYIHFKVKEHDTQLWVAINLMKYYGCLKDKQGCHITQLGCGGRPYAASGDLYSYNLYSLKQVLILYNFAFFNVLL